VQPLEYRHRYQISALELHAAMNEAPASAVLAVIKDRTMPVSVEYENLEFL